MYERMLDKTRASEREEVLEVKHLLCLFFEKGAFTI